MNPKRFRQGLSLLSIRLVITPVSALSWVLQAVHTIPAWSGVVQIAAASVPATRSSIYFNLFYIRPNVQCSIHLLLLQAR